MVGPDSLTKCDAAGVDRYGCEIMATETVDFLTRAKQAEGEDPSFIVMRADPVLTNEPAAQAAGFLLCGRFA